MPIVDQVISHTQSQIEVKLRVRERTIPNYLYLRYLIYFQFIAIHCAMIAGNFLPAYAQSDVVEIQEPAAAYKQLEISDFKDHGTDHVYVDDVTNVVGFNTIKSDAEGRLIIGKHYIYMEIDGVVEAIPTKLVHSFSIDHVTRSLLHGTKGKVIGSIPRGLGNIYHAIRPGAEMLTISYSDESGAIHGAVLLLPKKSKADVERGLADAGLFASGKFDPPDPVRDDRIGVVPEALAGKVSVKVALPDIGDQPLPAAYSAAIYEGLNAELLKSGLFHNVWRQGDSRSHPDAWTVIVRIKQFKKGNAGVRGGVPIFGLMTGGTLIRAELSVEDASGNIVRKIQVKGSKQMPGESIAAARILARRVSVSLGKDPMFLTEKS